MSVPGSNRLRRSIIPTSLYFFYNTCRMCPTVRLLLLADRTETKQPKVPSWQWRYTLTVGHAEPVRGRGLGQQG